MVDTANTKMVTTVLEQCRVSPPPDFSLTETLLPLTFFDLLWLNWPSLSRVYFYDFPCSTTEFTQTLVPHLKKSLASTLKLYYPLCGNLIKSTTLSTTPAIRYLKGDSVSLTIAEFISATKFKHLSGNHARDVEELFSLVPELPRGGVTDTGEGGSVSISPLLSIQVTLFPEHGFSIGFRNSHVVADGKSVSSFISMWASINAKQLIGQEDYDNDDSDNLPFYDRSVIKDPKGLATNYLKRMAQKRSNPFVHAAPQGLVQSTIVMNRAQIQGLKDSVPSQLQPVSTYVVVCAYVWTCMAKARWSLGRVMSDENEVEHFILAMDTRARLDPPIPSNYFGNAVLGCWVSLMTRQFLAQGGFVNAVKEIKNTIVEKTNNREELLKVAETFFDLVEATKAEKKFGVAGSPKFNYYGTDFGWGRPKKYEVVSEKFGLSGSRDTEGDLELGFCFPKDEMDVFTTFFTQGLTE